MSRIQAREIYEKLHNKVDPELVRILASLAERQQVQHQQIMSMAEGHDKILDMMAQVIQASGSVAKVGDKIAAKMGFSNASDMVKSFDEKDDDSGPTTPR